MNILFISYWGIEEGLTQSTVIPHVKILSQYNIIKNIILITIERGAPVKFAHPFKKLLHLPIQASLLNVPSLGQIIDFIRIPVILRKHCVKYKIDIILARGSLAGTLAYKVFKQSKIPFFVESFEPHADYMKDTGVWHKWGFKYLLQKKWEAKQCHFASGLMTVTEGYANYLKAKYTNNIQILAVPCATDTNIFKFSPEDRRQIRKRFGFSEGQLVCIYAGKFGGLYLNIGDLGILKKLFEHFPDLGIIFLTSTPEEAVARELKSHIRKEIRLIVRNVSHKQVPHYLSAADFALSLNKTFPSGKYLSPIKIGEYWANGLPVLMTEGIGDERDYLEIEKGGVLFNPGNLSSALNKLDEIISEPGHRARIPILAKKYRSFNTVKEAYQNLIIPHANNLHSTWMAN